MLSHNGNDYTTRDTSLATWLFYHGIEPEYCQNENTHVVFCYSDLADKIKPLATQWTLGNGIAGNFQVWMNTYRTILRMISETKTQGKIF